MVDQSFSLVQRFASRHVHKDFSSVQMEHNV